LNGDGKPDLIALNYYNGSMSVRLNNGDGTFRPETKYKVNSGPYSLALGDFNGDGNLDILTANSAAASSLAILPGNGDGTFSKALTNFAGINGSYANHSVVVADFNGDGRPDIASTRFSANSVSILTNTTLPCLQIKPASAGVRIAWPNWPGYNLQISSNTSVSSSWASLTNSCSIITGQKVITNSIANPCQFFRLIK